MYREIYEKLRALREEYEKIAVLAEKKQQAIKGKDCNALIAINEEEREHVALIARLERERLEEVSKVAVSLSLDPETLTVSETAKYADAKTGELLRNEAEKLTSCIKSVKEINEANRLLLEVNLDYTAFMLEMLTTINEPSSVYGASGGEEEYTSNRRNIFDSEV